MKTFSNNLYKELDQSLKDISIVNMKSELDIDQEDSVL
jgi:hypothetical protein